MHIVEIFLCYGLYSALRVCVCVWWNWGHCYSAVFRENLQEDEITAQSNVGECYSGCVFSCCAMYVRLCVRVRLFFPNIHPELLGLRGEFQSPDEL